MPVMPAKAELNLQLYARDALEDGGLLSIAVNPDGCEAAFRIRELRHFFYTTSRSSGAIVFVFSQQSGRRDRPSLFGGLD